MKVSVIIPVYKPDPEVFARVKAILKKQTVKHHLIEAENMPEAISTNTGLKKAKTDIVVTLSQDCVPEDEFWLENLIKPFKDKKVIASVSDTVVVPKDLWEKFDIFTKALTIREQRAIRTTIDARGCAYRKSLLEKVGYFNEDPTLIGMDYDLHLKIRDLGKIGYPGCKIYHYHPFTFISRLQNELRYAKGAGMVTRRYGQQSSYFWKALLRATPVIGLIPLIYVFPFTRAPFLFFVYLLLSPIVHVNYLWGFWKGFFTKAKKEK